jgi:subtilisin family serine protease
VEKDILLDTAFSTFTRREQIMKKFVTMLVLIALLVSVIPVAAAGGNTEAPGQARKYGNSVYIVQMAGAPVVAYDGGIPGYPATAPKQGQKVNQLDPKVIKYSDFLKTKHDKTIQSVGATKKLYSYTFSFDGFAAELTLDQAEAMKSQPGVLAVSKDELRTLDTSSTPTFLGLIDAQGNWLFPATGEGVVIGIVDGGIWPEHPSFSDRTGYNGNMTKGGKLGYQQIPGWNAKCVPGEMFTASNCNQKIIGAQYYNSGWGGNAGIDAQLPWEYNSPRDFGGHGTHTASTAGGNAGVPATGPAAVFGKISGIAPRARISVYKVCWETGAGGSCFNSDSVAAIDQAVADGVDVINFSISGSRTNFRDPVEIAFMYAAGAGVFVAASAGNSGPTASTVAHPGPWLTTVAAGTHNRDGVGSVTLGNNVTYTGASVATGVGPAPFIDAESAGLPGVDPTAVRLCFAEVDYGEPVLDPAKVAGKIVLCDRGVIARVNKSLAVMEAGGVGMVLVNTSISSINADFHFVPTVHLQSTDRAAVKAYAATAGATATINPATIVYNALAPYTASFSSRGPLLAGGGDLLKPDLIAPGQDILAAVAPPGNAGRLFDLYSGTSMSSPHVAGLAALFKQLYPSWSPMAIKSALMTSAGDVLDGPNTNPLVIFRQGAGHVKPMAAADPGLVFNSGWNDWLTFICNTQPQGLESLCSQLWGMGYPTDPSNLNTASIAIGDMAGTQTVTRSVTNVGSAAETYTASYTGLAGITVALPGSFSVNKGQTKSFSVTFTTAAAALNAYTGGQFTLTGDKGHVVRIPVVIRPVALAAPAEVNGSYSVIFGYDGPFTATARGLVPATLTPGTVADDPTDSTCSLTSPNAQLLPVAVPAGTTYARFELFDADVTPGSDIDLCVFTSGGTLVGSSASGTSAEQVNLLNPAADTYTVVVQGWGVVGSSPFVLHTWLLDSMDAGNMTVTAPAAATIGATGNIGLAFSGLTTGVKYLGSVVYGGAAGMPNPTIVRVDAP